MRPSISILGVGALGEIFTRALIRAGWDPSDLTVVDQRQDRAQEVADATGTSMGTDIPAAVSGRDVVMIIVKPKDVPPLVEELAAAVTAEQLVLSVAAGVPLETYEDALPNIPVVRAMPNTPAAVGEAMTAYCAGAHATRASLDLAAQILQAVGRAVEIPEEHMDAVTAVSGSGPAYLFLLGEAMIAAGIEQGLPLEISEILTKQTLRGAGMLLATSEMSPGALRDQVTSPGGTTAAALGVFERADFRGIVERALQAAAVRSRELGSS